MNDPWYAGSQYPQIITTKRHAWQELHQSLSGRKSTCQSRRHRFNPWVKKIPWRRKWQPTPVFCLENPMGRGAYWATVHGGHKRVRHNLKIKQQKHDKCRSSPNWLQHEREAKSHQKAGVTIMLGAKGVATLLFQGLHDLKECSLQCWGLVMAKRPSKPDWVQSRKKGNQSTIFFFFKMATAQPFISSNPGRHKTKTVVSENTKTHHFLT